MRKIFLDRRVWRNSRDNWVSFESDPHLRVTKKNIYGRCVPCQLMRHLYPDSSEREGTRLNSGKLSTVGKSSLFSELKKSVLKCCGNMKRLILETNT